MTEQYLQSVILTEDLQTVDHGGEDKEYEGHHGEAERHDRRHDISASARNVHSSEGVLHSSLFLREGGVIFDEKGVELAVKFKNN